MKKTLLIIAWIIIVTGLGFILFHQLTKDDAPTVRPTEETATNTPSDDLPPTSTPKPAAPPTTTTIELIPKSFEGHVAAGDEDISGFFIESAIREYEAAFEIDSNDINLLLKLGDAYRLNNEPDKAKATYLQAQQIDSSELEIYLRLIQSHLDLREVPGAKNIISQLDQTHPDVQYYNAILKIHDQDKEGARAIFQAIVDAQLTGFEGITANAQRFLDKYTTFEFFTEANPLMLDAGLAKALTEVNQFALAIPATNIILDQQSNYRDAWIIQGYAYLNIGQYDEAIDALEQAKALDPDNPNTLFFIGISHYAKGEIDKALVFLEEAESNGFIPQENINKVLGEIYSSQARFTEAAASYQKALAYEQDDVEIYIKLVWLNIDHLGRAQSALTLAQENQRLRPDQAMSYNLLGWAHMANGQLESAKANLKTALEIDPRLEAAYYNFGRLYEVQGSTITAKEYYRKAVDVGEGSEIARLAAKNYDKLTHGEQSDFLKANITNSNF